MRGKRRNIAFLPCHTEKEEEEEEEELDQLVWQREGEGGREQTIHNGKKARENSTEARGGMDREKERAEAFPPPPRLFPSPFSLLLVPSSSSSSVRKCLLYGHCGKRKRTRHEICQLGESKNTPKTKLAW